MGLQFSFDPGFQGFLNPEFICKNPINLFLSACFKMDSWSKLCILRFPGDAQETCLRFGRRSGKPG